MYECEILVERYYSNDFVIFIAVITLHFDNFSDTISGVLYFQISFQKHDIPDILLPVKAVKSPSKQGRKSECDNSVTLNKYDIIFDKAGI